MDDDESKRTRDEPERSNRVGAIERRIYILGSGNVGKLVAHSLAGLPKRPPITLLLHRPYLMKHWQDQGQAIKLTANHIAEVRTGYDVEMVLPINKLQAKATPSPEALYASDTADGGRDVDPTSVIHNLILTTKAQKAVYALSAVKDRLTQDSTILFLQNGMGVIEEANKTLFSNIHTRPNYIVGITTHGVYSEDTFSAVHAGFGTIALALTSRHALAQQAVPNKQRHWAPSSLYLLRTMIRTPALAAVGFHETDMMQQQLEKLALNAVINPLTVMYDCKNGGLLYNYHITRTMRLLLSEISLVIRSLPELQSIPNVRLRFAPDRLETLTVALASRTFNNISSMLQDVRKGKGTEIDYINGYLVSKGEQMGFKCVMNYMLTQMVKGKQQRARRKLDDHVPFELAEDTKR